MSFVKRIGTIAVLAAGLTIANQAVAQQVGIGTMGQGTLGYSMGAAIAKVLSDNKLGALVQPNSGTSAYLPLLQAGELDLGIANIAETTEAVAGEGSFAGRKLDKLRVVTPLFPFKVGVFVKDSSPIKTIADLKGQALTYGFTAQVTLNRVLNGILATGGLSEKDIKPVMVPNVVRGADDFASSKADAAFFAIGSGKVSEVDASVGGVRFLPVAETPEALAALKKILPEGYITTVQPNGKIAGIKVPTPSVAYDYVLVAGAHVPDDVIAQVVKTLHANKAALVAGLGAFNEFDPNAMHKDIPAEYHAGALAAFKELGQ